MLSLSIFQVCSGQAQDAAEVALEKKDFKEFRREGADISGAVVVGVQVQRPAPDGPFLMGYIPREWKDGVICAQVVSADGKYEAYAPYRVPANWPGKTARLDFPTAYPDQLRGFSKDGVGALISQGDCSEPKETAKSVVLWNATSLEMIDVMVNSFRADDVFAYVANRPQPVRCLNIELNSSIAYDSKCRIDANGIHGKTKIQIYRINGGKPSRPTDIDIWFPALR